MSKPVDMTPAEQTRQSLVLAALDLFGQKGFEAASTREIAQAANANIGSIAYHFGGKEGLRMAAADYIVETIGGVAQATLGGIDRSLTEGMPPQAARAMLSGALEHMVDFVLRRPEAAAIVPFMLQELARPTAALDRIYEGVFEPLHRLLCALWERATGEAAESASVKITVFTMIGQIIYFRIAAAAVLRRMGWSTYGPAEAQQIRDVAIANLNALLSTRQDRAS